MIDYYLAPAPTAMVLFVSVLAAIEAGRYLGRVRLRRIGEIDKGVGSAGGAIFALLGLILAFTFSGAAGKYEDRRNLIADEANAVGTAWLRIDMLPQESQSRVRELFRSYLDARLAIYAAIPDLAAARLRLDESLEVQQQLWIEASAAVRSPAAPAGAAVVMLPALNQMFDIATLRTVAMQKHPPIVIFILLGVLALMTSVLVGYEGAQSPERRWLHHGGYALLMAVAIFVILELEYPRWGIVRIDSADQLLLDLRASMQ